MPVLIASDRTKIERSSLEPKLQITKCFSKIYREKAVKNMSDDNSTGNNLIWAITTIIIVAIIAGALYYSGFLSGNRKQKIDVEVSAPNVAR